MKRRYGLKGLQGHDLEFRDLVRSFVWALYLLSSYSFQILNGLSTLTLLGEFRAAIEWKGRQKKYETDSKVQKVEGNTSK